MKRREFITLLGGLAVAYGLPLPREPRAQAAAVRRVGVLMIGAATEARPQLYAAASCKDSGS